MRPVRKVELFMENRDSKSRKKETATGKEQEKETRLTPVSAVSPGDDDTPRPEEVDPSELGSTRMLTPSEEDRIAAKEQRHLPQLPIGQEGSVLGDFQIAKKLGEGAMGAVYLARQVSFDNRPVALKVLFPHIASNQKLVNRLRLEAEVMFDLDHPSIVKSFGLYEIDGWHCIAMEYVDGESLQKWIDRLGKISVAEAMHITLVCAHALQHAHEKSLIHRDVKPDNVLITRKGVVKVTDLGMVKKLEEDEEKGLTMTGHAVGTPWYMPLEQAKNAKDADARCDIYALGCMLYCMVTGRPPFTGHTIVDVIQAKEMGHFPAARSVNSEVPERLDLIIAKMAHKLPKYRYQNCLEVIKDLESLELASEELEFPGQVGKKPTTELRGPSSMVATVATSLAGQDTDSDRWYIKMKNSSGESVIKTMLTPQMSKMVAEGTLKASVQISRSSKEGFRALATYKEFQNVALGRVSRKAMDVHTSRNKTLYDKIVKQEIQRDDKPKEYTTAQYWMEIFIRCAVITVGVGALLAALYFFVIRPFQQIF